MTNIIESKDIAQKFTESLVLVHLNCHRYGSEKTDKAETTKVKQSHNIHTAIDTFRVRKQTLPIRDSLEAVRRHDNSKMWGCVKKFGAPYAEGIYMIPASRYLDFMSEMRRHLAERQELIKRVGNEYSLMKEAAKATLGTAYNESEYPAVDQVLAKYDVTFEVTPIANPSQLKLSVVDEAAAAIQQAVNDTFAEKAATLQPYLCEVLLKPLCHLSKVCQSIIDNPKVRVFDSAFENVHEAAAQAKGLNISDDDQIRNAVFGIEQSIPRHRGSVKENPAGAQMLLDEVNNIIFSLNGEPPLTGLAIWNESEISDTTPLTEALDAINETDTTSPEPSDATAKLASLGWV